MAASPVGMLASAEPTDRRAASTAALASALIVVPLALFALLAWQHAWIIDDGFINLRVVRQLRAGNGPVFNAGERVEAFTSPLWLALLAIGDLVLPLRLEWVAVMLGIGCAVGGIALAVLGAAHLVGRRPGRDLLLPVGMLVPVAVTPFWYFSSSGLEMGLVFAWLGASLFVLGRWADTGDRLPPVAAVLLGLGVLIRPELGLASALFAALVIVVQWRSDGWRARLALLGWIVALPLAYQVFRMGYYGTLVPNTALAKEASRTSWSRGWRYLRDFARAYALWFPLLVLALGAYVPLLAHLHRRRARRAQLVVAAFVVAGAMSGAYIVAVGGDYIHARLLLPALFALCAPVAVVPATRGFAAGLLLVPWVLVAGISYREPGGVYRPSAHGVTVDDYGYGAGGERWAWYQGPGVYLVNRRLTSGAAPGVPQPTVASVGLGVTAYAFGPRLRVMDLLGLADPMTSHLEMTGRGLTGHEKPLPGPWIAARLVAVGEPADAREFDVYGFLPRLIPPARGAEFTRQVAWARAALDCAPLRDLRESYTEPLTVGRFLDNIFGSFRRTRLRIPPDPRAAYHALCGPGAPPGVR